MRAKIGSVGLSAVEPIGSRSTREGKGFVAMTTPAFSFLDSCLV